MQLETHSWRALILKHSANFLRLQHQAEKQVTSIPYSHLGKLRHFLRLTPFLKLSEEIHWYDDALRCIYVPQAPGVVCLGFRGCPPWSRDPYTKFCAVQQLQPLSIPWRKKEFTIPANKFTFRGKDKTSLLSQMEFSWVTMFNPGFYFALVQISLRKKYVYIHGKYLNTVYF